MLPEVRWGLCQSAPSCAGGGMRIVPWLRALLERQCKIIHVLEMNFVLISWENCPKWMLMCTHYFSRFFFFDRIFVVPKLYFPTPSTENLLRLAWERVYGAMACCAELAKAGYFHYFFRCFSPNIYIFVVPKLYFPTPSTENLLRPAWERDYGALPCCAELKVTHMYGVAMRVKGLLPFLRSDMTCYNTLCCYLSVQ